MNAFHHQPREAPAANAIDDLMYRLDQESSAHSSRLELLQRAIEEENRRHLETIHKLQDSLRSLHASNVPQPSEPLETQSVAGSLDDPKLWPVDLRGSVIYMGDIISPIDVKWDAESDDDDGDAGA